MYRKHKAGLSYIEITIAFALFAIIMVATIPLLSQVSQNMEYAQFHYAAYRNADNIRLAARDAIKDGGNIDAAVRASAERHEVKHFSVWVSGTHGTMEIHCNGLLYCHNDVAMPCYALPHCHGGVLGSVSSDLGGFNGHMTTIMVAVYSDDGYIIGRAVGMIA